MTEQELAWREVRHAAVAFNSAVIRARDAGVEPTHFIVIDNGNGKTIADFIHDNFRLSVPGVY